MVTHCGTQKIETDRLELRQFQYSDDEDMLEYYRWAVIEKKSQICIGQIAFFLVNTQNHFGEIEYCIGSKFQRNGYMTEAVKAIIDYGFNDMNLHKVQVCHKENNEASKGVIQKCKFKYEGALRDFFYMNGKYVSRLYYSILREEWGKDSSFQNENALGE